MPKGDLEEVLHLIKIQGAANTAAIKKIEKRLDNFDDDIAELIEKVRILKEDLSDLSGQENE